MDAANCSLAAGLVGQSYVVQGSAALSARRRLIKALLSNRTLPAEGWDEATIEMLLQDAALMDSNTFPGQVGLGEREGRVACPLVARRHGRLAHGIGRSGDITAEQPKAAGSSLLAKLCAALAADALKLAGLLDQGPAVVLPCATGMTLTLVLLAAAAGPPAQVQAHTTAATPQAAKASASGAPDREASCGRQLTGDAGTTCEAAAKAALQQEPPAICAAAAMPQPPALQQPQEQQQQQQQQSPLPPLRRYVVWSRIDQKTCLKSITAANLVPVVVELKRQGDELVTDVTGIREAVERVGPENVAAVVTTTSCFAPRVCDDVASVAKLCATLGVTHVVNNAYGVQSAAILAALTAACRRGRVDAIVQSTDKNFMVPVGGAVISAPAGRKGSAAGWLVQAVAKGYPGRAAMTPLLDLLTTLLFWGAAGWKAQLRQREELFVYLRDQLQAAASDLGERVLSTPGNTISLAMTLDGLAAAAAALSDSAAAEAAAMANAAGAAGAGTGSGSCNVGKERDLAQRAGVSFFGAMLWARNVSGTRVLSGGKQQTIGGITFQNYGCHAADYPHPYVTAAAAIGGTQQEVDVFISRLIKAYRELKDKWARQRLHDNQETKMDWGSEEH